MVNKLLSAFDVSIPLRVTGEHVAYYRSEGYGDAGIQGKGDTGKRGSGDLEECLPFIWHAQDPEVKFYGLPNGNTGLIKIGQHRSGPEVDPEIACMAEEGRVEPINRFVGSALRGLSQSPPTFETCLYASTPDDDFVIDRIGDLVLGVGFGGHGFKFAPLVGKMIADLVEGTDVAMPRFSLGRFGVMES